MVKKKLEKLSFNPFSTRDSIVDEDIDPNNLFNGKKFQLLDFII